MQLKKIDKKWVLVGIITVIALFGDSFHQALNISPKERRKRRSWQTLYHNDEVKAGTSVMQISLVPQRQSMTREAHRTGQDDGNANVEVSAA